MTRVERRCGSRSGLVAGTYTRDVDFTADGKACMSNNPVPAAALEGGVLQLVCFDVVRTEVSAL